MDITPRQLKLLAYVIEQHGTQKRKYNLEPYWFHLVRVGTKLEKLIPLGTEVGLCHDLVEDVPGLTFAVLTAALESFNYDKAEVDYIVSIVKDLTDIYTPDAFPNLNRTERKALEAHRLWYIQPNAQTAKYVDLEDNTITIVPYDPDFARIYMLEKEYILKKMNKGDAHMYDAICELVRESKRKLGL